MTRFRTSILAVALLLAAAPPPRGARAGPAEFLPASSAFHDEIEALAARGLLDSLAVYTRPLARSDVARALDRARRLHPGIEDHLHFRRLEREFARELSDLAASANPSGAQPGGGPADPDTVRETGPLVDTGPPTQRLRIQLAAHARGDYDEKRGAAHFRMRDESSLTARGGLHLGSAVAAWEEIGITRIRGQRGWIDAIAAHTDVEVAVLRAGATARAGPITAGLGYDSFRWGPGRRGTLLLSDAAGPMTFLSLQGSFGGRVTATALTGVLSRVDQRYLAAHRLEWSPSARFTLGLAEAVRYRAEGVDLLYAGGLVPFTLVERIRIRDASSDATRGLERSNVMASADAVWRPWPSLSFHGEALVDDFATESADMPDRFAYQLGFRSERPYGARAARFLGEYTRVRNFTYSVEYGLDFAHRGRPLGFALGPDVENVWLETALDLSRDWQLHWTGDFTNRGEGRLGVPWITGTQPVPGGGLSGIVEERREVWADARWLPRDNVDLSAGAGYRRVRNENHEAGFTRAAWLARLAVDIRY